MDFLQRNKSLKIDIKYIICIVIRLIGQKKLKKIL